MLESREIPLVTRQPLHDFESLILIPFRIEKIRESTDIPKDIFQSKRYFVEIGCLFVMNQGSHAVVMGHVTVM